MHHPNELVDVSRLYVGQDSATGAADLAYLRLVNGLLYASQAVFTRNSRVCRLLVAPQFTFTKAPLVTLRKTAWKNALREMEWVLSGSESIHDLHPAVHAWWAPWADAEGKLFNHYGKALRRCAGHDGRVVDQVQYLIDAMSGHPYSRRAVISTWNTADMIDPRTRLTNCWGSLIQCFGDADGRLHLKTYQRSCDTVCGLPANWIQIWAFMMWVARRSGMRPGSLTWVGGDVHLYDCHADLAQRIVAADPQRAAPDLVYAPTSDDFKADDFTLSGPYTPGFEERAEMVV